MTPERWKQIDGLAQAALKRVGDERAVFLDEACAGDEALRREVESQIAYQQQASRFLEEPAFKHAAELIADSQPETESMEGRTISHYRILSKLGAGGMGDVFLAQDNTLSRKVAIKFLSQNSIAGEQARRRLVREARAAAALDHPHICAVHEVVEEAGYSFIVMQYVEGETLAARIQRGPIELREGLDIAVQIADALAAAHSHRIIHRDVKPQNVMLTTSGQVKVLDFGLARIVREGIDSLRETESLLSGPGLVVGTVPYMSPEQVRAEDLDNRTDIFSFGAVLYEMFSGRTPFQGPSMGATMSAILTSEPAPLARYASDVPDELQRVVSKALSKDKEGRYQTMKDLLIDLRELKQKFEFEAKLGRSIEPVQTSGSIVTRSTSGAAVVIGEIKRHKLGVSLIVAAAVFASLAAFFYFSRQSTLTEKDTILLADFENKTGDEVFDGALKQALAVQLEQSPFLNIYTGERVKEMLRFMGRPPDERLTREVAREICVRAGLKAMLVGSIASLGSHYAIALEAVNAQTSDVLAREQVEAESKEEVLSALGRAATRLREKLGESLTLIQKFDVPIQLATTPSLDALRAFSLGIEQASKGRFPESINFHKRAIELDPNFALAHVFLGGMYLNTRQDRLAVESMSKAYALRDRVTEREKFLISHAYFRYFELDSRKTFDVLQIWKQTYPRDPVPPNALTTYYARQGQLEKTLEAARAAISLSPNGVVSRANLANSLIATSRFDEAKEACEGALQEGFDGPDFHRILLSVAFIDGDTAAVQRQIEWASGTPNEYEWQADIASFDGRWREAQKFARKAIDLAKPRNKEVAAQVGAVQACYAAVFGEFAQAKTMAAESLALESSPVSFFPALALAISGESLRAKRLADDLRSRYPKDDLINGVWLPLIQAQIELQRGKPERAIDLLQDALRSDAGRLWPEFVRGQAYLKLNKATEATTEFQKMLDNRGKAPLSPLYALAHLGVARAARLADTAKSRKAYQDFFALWKDADADLRILIEAKKEFAALK